MPARTATAASPEQRRSLRRTDLQRVAEDDALARGEDGAGRPDLQLHLAEGVGGGVEPREVDLGVVEALGDLQAPGAGEGPGAVRGVLIVLVLALAQAGDDPGENLVARAQRTSRLLREAVTGYYERMSRHCSTIATLALLGIK